MANTDIYLTQETLHNLEKELHTLETVTKKQAVEELKVARGHGDLNENFEFIAARDELRKINRKIAELKGILAFAKTVNPVVTDEVSIGSIFNATIIKDGVSETKCFELFGYADFNKTIEAINDSSKPRPITVSSPFGKAVHRKKAGEAFTYVDPEHNRVIGEVVSIVSQIEVKTQSEKMLIK